MPKEVEEIDTMWMRETGSTEHLSTLPNEILHHILKDVDIVDISRISKTCRALYQFTNKNQALFQEKCLQKIDGSHTDTRDWEEELHLLAKVEKILGSKHESEKLLHIPFMAQTVSRLITQAKPSKNSRTFTFLSQHFANILNREAFFCQSDIFHRARRDTMHLHPPRNTRSESLDSYNDRQASAKMHCLYGVPERWIGSPAVTHTYPYACSVVYDLRNYTQGTQWGPFRDDGKATVDWEKLESIMIILSQNLKLSGEATSLSATLLTKPFDGANPDSFIPISVTSLPEPAGPSNPDDPYNISGTYMRMICFLDFHELHDYNFGSTINNNHNIPLPALNTREATRILFMEITVTSIKQPGEEGHHGHGACVYFEGISRPTPSPWDPNTTSRTRGMVQLTQEGEVRWTMYSVYWGEERWKSEGIQIGGENSRRGVFGFWFEKNYSAEGPAGPSAFWKISNEIDEKKRNILQFEDDEDEDDDYVGDSDDEN